MSPTGKQYNFEVTTPTIEKFIRDNYGKINVDPEGQRLDTELKLEGTDKPSKAQGIIAGFLCGLHPGNFLLNNTPEATTNDEVIDGGHRARYTKAFVDNKFRDFFTKKTFNELPEEVQERFLKIQLTVIRYFDLTPEDVAYIFQSTNKSTDVNHQEMLNSYNEIPVARYIREMSRPVPGRNNDPHRLFEYADRRTKRTYDYVSFDNHRLRIDEMVARLFYRYYDGGGLGTCDRKNLESMYNDYPSEDQMIKLNVKVKKCLDFTYRMAKVASRKDRKLTLKEYSIYTRLYLYLEETFGEFNYNDKVLFDTIDKAYAPFRIKYVKQIKELQAPSPFDFNKTIGKQFNDSLNEYDTRDHFAFPIEQLVKRCDLREAITDLDPSRFFSKEDRIAKLVEQGNVCVIDGLSLTISEAEGAHIIAHTLGGRTEYDNLAMVRACYNKEMGSMSVTDYQSIFNLDKSA
jgi:hypothetical protein